MKYYFPSISLERTSTSLNQCSDPCMGMDSFIVITWCLKWWNSCTYIAVHVLFKNGSFPYVLNIIDILHNSSQSILQWMKSLQPLRLKGNTSSTGGTEWHRVCYNGTREGNMLVKADTERLHLYNWWFSLFTRSDSLVSFKVFMNIFCSEMQSLIIQDMVILYKLNFHQKFSPPFTGT